MILAHISDTHTQHKSVNVPSCDILVHSGDIGSRTFYEELEDFLIWFAKQDAKIKIFIAGNHDIDLDSERLDLVHPDENKRCLDIIKEYESKDIFYLKDSFIEYEGLKIYGSPYSPSFYKQYWVFNKDRGFEIRNEWNKIPRDVDILITHSPPHGILDYAPGNLNVGCEELLDAISTQLTNVKLHCFGHIHNNLGLWQQQTSYGNTIFSNAAVLDNNYHLQTNLPNIIEI